MVFKGGKGDSPNYKEIKEQVETWILAEDQLDFLSIVVLAKHIPVSLNFPRHKRKAKTLETYIYLHCRLALTFDC